jgi:hypothetical protein
MNAGRIVTLAAVLVIAPATAAGQTPTFTYATPEEAEAAEKAKQIEWKADATAGLVVTTGNSRITTLTGAAHASRKAQGNKFAIEGSLAYARSSVLLAVDENASGTIEEDEISRSLQVTSRAWMTKARYDRYLTLHNSVYVATGLAGDRLAGKELVANGQVGYSRELYAEGIHLVLAEAGYDFTYEDPVVGPGASIHSARAFVGYSAKLNDTAAIEASGEGLFNLNTYDTAAGEVGALGDNRLTGKLSFNTLLFDNLALRVAFEARYDSAPSPRPPFALPYAPGFVPLADELDTKTEATLIYTFL